MLVTVRRHFWINDENIEHPEKIYTTLAAYDGEWRWLYTEDNDEMPWVTREYAFREKDLHYPTAEVVAWMPLPEPYRGEKNNAK